MDKMNEHITENIHYQRGYDRGYSDAQESLSIKFEKILSKNSDKSYKNGFKEGLKAKDEGEEIKYKYILAEQDSSVKPILMTEKEAEDLNKNLLLYGEYTRYIKI
tara:strand:+ start:128 stop:442 length:315 start_codon:yes stop_codon:yes gene_type:complete